MSSDPTEKCPQCGAVIPAGAPLSGICPRCLLGQAIEPETQALAPGVQPGQRIGPYRLDRIIGEGGMGTVWLASQETPIRRTIALKVIKPGMDTKDVIARFESERQALALMDHPNIAKVLDAGASADGHPYFVMEYVRGVSITQYCDDRRLSSRERLALFIMVCQAVQHAHQRGVIHRDIKPSNVLVTEQDGKAIPKVIDFGVAKATRQRLTERTVFTQLGALIGTPEYMSPEQAESDGLDVETTTDVYSLGVLLYELLAGMLPFDPKELRKAGYQEMRRIIREQEPPTPARRVSGLGTTAAELAGRRQTDPAGLIRLLRGDLDWITLKALEKDRRRRYQSAAELAADVDRHLQDQPVAASPPSYLYRMRKAARRRRTPLLAAAALIAAIALGWLVSLRNRPAPPRPFDSISITRLTSSGKVGAAAISPDGKQVAYAEEDATKLWVRDIESGNKVKLAETENYIYEMHYSPKGDYIYYSYNDAKNPPAIYRIPSLGGRPFKVVDYAARFTLSPDGRQVMHHKRDPDTTRLLITPSNGGPTRVFVSRHEPNNYVRLLPIWAPNEKVVVVYASEQSSGHLRAFRFPGGEEYPFSLEWAGFRRAAWLPDSSGLLVTGGRVSVPEESQIWRVDFPRGSSRAITTGASRYGSISLTADGRIAAATASDVRATLWVVPIGRGAPPRAITFGLVSYNPVWSLNGEIAYDHEDGNSSGSSAIGGQGTNQRLLLTGGAMPEPCGADGSFVIATSRAGRSAITRVGPTGLAQVLVESESDNPVCTPDGKWVVYVRRGPTGHFNIWRLPAEGGPPRRITTEDAMDPQVSPDGKLLMCYYGSLFTSTPSRLAILDMETGAVVKIFDIQRDFGYWPMRWARDGNAVTYIDKKSKLWRLPLDGGEASMLMDFAPDEIFGFDWSPDGTEVVVAKGQWNEDVVLIRDTTRK